MKTLDGHANAVRYWKVLDAQGRSCHGGSMQWSLPLWTGRRWVPGQWTKRITGNIAPCERGYHLCRAGDVLSWLYDAIWVAEIHPDAGVVATDNKVVTSGPVRLIAGTAWNEEVARLFAVACALDVLPFYEQRHPGDTRPSDALVVAWQYAHGAATDEERAAARDAASAAARDAAGAAARDAAGAAAGAAAGDAAWAAARAAAWDAAGAAAWAAAGAAAGDAAGAAAGDAAWAAAGAAARAAARDAARDAARGAQAARLLRYLDGEVDI